MIMVNTNVENAQCENWQKELEDFLQQACVAEANKDYESANALFRRALYYDAKLQPEVTNVKDFIDSAGPVYKAKQA